MKTLKLIIPVLAIGYWLLASPLFANAATNIDPTDKWGWSDKMGWINFYNSSSVTVKDDRIEGYGNFCGSDNDCNPLPASYISFDCATSPYAGTNICFGQSSPQIDYRVYNDGVGNLSGWAWSDDIGWISFCGGSGTISCPGSIAYQVEISSSTGDFSGWAWNDEVGWISFNCSDGATCGTVSYRTSTLWSSTSAASGNITSVTFDTGYPNGVNYNSIIWKGTQGTGTVSFQLATSNLSTGPWNFVGPDNTSNTYYQPSAQNVPIGIVGANHINKRYYRYKVFISRPEGGTSPVVQDVIVNWSP